MDCLIGSLLSIEGTDLGSDEEEEEDELRTGLLLYLSRIFMYPPHAFLPAAVYLPLMRVEIAAVGDVSS